MTLGGLIWRSVRQRPLSSTLTAASVALGVMLVVAILLLREDVEDRFANPGKGYSLVVGPSKSEPLALVLSAVFQIGQSAGFLPFDALTSLENDPSTKLAVPCAVGDSFRGYRVVATTDAIFSRHFPMPEGETPESKLAEGRPFRFEPHALAAALEDMKSGAAGAGGHAHDHEHEHDHSHDVNEAVLGAEVARRTGIGPGALIEATHGIEGGKEHKDEHAWTVCGVLKPTGTALDRVVFINLDSFYRIADHAGGIIPETGEAGLSFVLLFPKGGFHKPNLLSRLMKRSELQVAEVSAELKKLFATIGNVNAVFLVVAVLVVVVGVTSVMVAIYNTMSERRREIAILRAIGAKARFVTAAIVGESAALAGIGGVAGILLGHALLWAAGPFMEEATGIRPDPARILVEELLVAAAVTLVGALADAIPAMKAYRTDVARNLAPVS